MSITSDEARRIRRSRLILVLAYAGIGIAWIVGSDAVLEALPASVREPVATAKGIIYVLLTGFLLWVVLLARDTLLERQRTRLAASEERHRLLAERQQDVVYRFRLEPTPGFEYVSPSIAAITGHTPEEHYADPELGRSLIHPDDLPALGRAAAGAGGPVLVRWRRPDGTAIFTEHLATPIRDEAGHIVAVEGVARDVSDRLRADEQHRGLARALEASPTGVAVLSFDGGAPRMTYMNPAFIAFAPTSPMAGADVDHAFRVDGEPTTLAALIERARAGSAFEIDAELARPGDAPRHVRLIVSPLLHPDGTPEGAVVVGADLTDSIARRRAEARLGLVLDASPAPIVVVDAFGLVTDWNPAAARVFGWAAGDVVGRPFPLLADDTRPAYRELTDRLHAGAGTATAEIELRHRDGRRLPCLVQVAPLGGGEGSPAGMVVVIEDLTAQIEVQYNQARLASAIDAAGEAILITDLAGVITYVNPAFERISGYRRDELVGANPRVLQSGLTPASTYADLWRRLAAGQPWRGVLMNRRKDGSLLEEEATISPVFGPDGAPIAYVGVKRDLTLEQTLAAGLATELTDRAAVQEAMARADLGETPEETAELLCSALAGFGGVDKVAIVHLPPGIGPGRVIGVAGDVVPDEAGAELDAALIDALRERAAGPAWSSLDASAPRSVLTEPAVGDGLATVTAPVRHRGRAVALLHVGARTDAPDAWVARHVRIASELAAHVGPILGPQLSRRDAASASADEIRAIIDTGAFAPVFQPVCDLVTRQPVGWESFTRFRDGVPPLQRFADARTLGVGLELELACGARAIEAFTPLRRRGWLAVNVSPALVLDGLAAALLEGVAGPVVLELTEAPPASDYPRLRRAIEALRAPVMLAVDDAGAGAGSLGHVLDLRPDFVKLDFGLIHDIDGDTGRQAMVAGMVHFAARTSTQLVAEGVETEAELTTLVRLGVALGQGHLLGAPSADGAPA